MSPLTRLLAGDRGGQIFLALLVSITITVPVLALAVPETSALHAPTYVVTLLGKYMTYALLALSPKKKLGGS